MRIAVDAMGGDFAPGEIVAGTVQAARSLSNVEKFYLVGDEQAIRTELRKHGDTPPSIEILHASEVISMDDSPVSAIRKKKDSSIGRAVDMVKKGDAEAVFSAGNTGAAVAATSLKLRMLEGVERPAIATVFPTPVKPFVLLDAGATPECNAKLLYQFAVMGSAYSREILGQPNPKVGLLNIGGEAAKGNEITKEAYKLMDASDLNFIGNVESSDLFEGRVDVAVCDGFVGNVVLKTSEATAKAVGRWFKDEFTKNIVRKLGALLMMPGINRIKKTTDPGLYGGAPLLGVNGVCIIGHGSSSAFAVGNALRVAMEFINHRLNESITKEVSKTQVVT